MSTQYLTRCANIGAVLSRKWWRESGLARGAVQPPDNQLRGRTPMQAQGFLTPASALVWSLFRAAARTLAFENDRSVTNRSRRSRSFPTVIERSRLMLRPIRRAQPILRRGARRIWVGVVNTLLLRPQSPLVRASASVYSPNHCILPPPSDRAPWSTKPGQRPKYGS